MADDQPQDQPQQQIQLRIDESKMTSAYANTIRTAVTADEVVLDFGMNIPVQNPGQQPVMNFAIGSRVIMNWAGAKRLAMSVGGLVRQYEQRYGEIQINQNQQAPQANPGGGPA